MLGKTDVKQKAKKVCILNNKLFVDNKAVKSTDVTFWRKEMLGWI